VVGVRHLILGSKQLTQRYGTNETGGKEEGEEEEGEEEEEEEEEEEQEEEINFISLQSRHWLRICVVLVVWCRVKAG